MKKLFKRLIAYVIDMMVVMLISQSLSGVPFLNPQLDKYNQYYNDYLELYEVYGNFKVDLVSDFEDKLLTEKEYQSLIEDNSEYKDILEKFYDDNKLEEEEYNKLVKTIDDEYMKNYKKVYYKIEKNSIAYFIIYLVTVFVYFVGFNKITGGQTLGKKLTRLKIRNNNSYEEVSILSYIIRVLILYQPVYYLVKLIGINFLSSSDYQAVTSVFYYIQYYLELIVIVTIMHRLDGRGLHDLLAKTKVVMIDKEGNEVKEPIVTLVRKDKVQVKKKQKVVEEESSE